MKQSAKDKKRIRRVIPKQKTFIVGLPTNNDVVSGRGGLSNNHSGNKAYWKKILANRNEYRECKSNAEKTAVAQKVVNSIQSKGGRFVQKEKGENGRWFVLPKKVVMSKVKQALRDRYVPNQLPLVFEGRQFFPVDDESDGFEFPSEGFSLSMLL